VIYPFQIVFIALKVGRIATTRLEKIRTYATTGVTSGDTRAVQLCICIASKVFYFVQEKLPSFSVSEAISINYWYHFGLVECS